jgi:hypothetical protein
MHISTSPSPYLGDVGCHMTCLFTDLRSVGYLEEVLEDEYNTT